MKEEGRRRTIPDHSGLRIRSFDSSPFLFPRRLDPVRVFSETSTKHPDSDGRGHRDRRHALSKLKYLPYKK